MSLSVEVDASWVTKPDIVAKLMPSKRWRMSHLDIRPAMYVRVDYLSVTGRLRLVFPLQQSLPIFNGMSICFLRRPEVCSPLFPHAPSQHIPRTAACMKLHRAQPTSCFAMPPFYTCPLQLVVKQCTLRQPCS